MLLPRAEFWRLWGCALVLAAIACLCFHAIGSAHGETLRPSTHVHHHRHDHHHHHHHHHRDHDLDHVEPLTRRHHPRAGHGDAVAIAMRFLGSGNPTGSHRAWCGDFMNLLEHTAGRTGIRTGLASSWRAYGHAAAPVRGAIAVFPHHVARVIGRVGDRLQIISGNWGNRVGIGWVHVRSAIAFRKP